jgi:hypothetical protein
MFQRLFFLILAFLAPVLHADMVDNIQQPKDTISFTSPSELVVLVIRYTIGIAGILWVIGITWWGIQMILSVGEDEKQKKSSIYDYLFGTLSDNRMTGIFRGERSLIRTIITSMYLRILSSFSLLFVMVQDSFAKIGIGDQPANSILKNASGWTFYDFLAFIEWFLLKVVLPIVIVGAFLYVSYKLFLAEGNEEENKKAWKAVTYASIWIISIMIAYALIAIVSRVSI